MYCFLRTTAAWSASSSTGYWTMGEVATPLGVCINRKSKDVEYSRKYYCNSDKSAVMIASWADFDCSGSASAETKYLDSSHSSAYFDCAASIKYWMGIKYGNQTGSCAQDDANWEQKPLVVQKCIAVKYSSGSAATDTKGRWISSCTACSCSMQHYKTSSCSYLTGDGSATTFSIDCVNGVCSTADPTQCTTEQKCPVVNTTTTAAPETTPASKTTTSEGTNTVVLPLPFQIEGDITECGQTLHGVMNPYYETSNGHPQVYRFDFEEWSDIHLISGEEGRVGGFYKCEETELEQAQVFGLMAKDDILTSVNKEASCGTTKKLKMLSAAKQVVAGVNYRANIELCDGLQLALVSFFVPLPTDNTMQKPINVSFLHMTDATFTLDPCDTPYPLKIEPIISAEHYNERLFYDRQYVPVINNSIKCPNGHNWQWTFAPNTTRYGTEYIISWVGFPGSEAETLFNLSDGAYSVDFECASSAANIPTTTTGIEIPLPFQTEGDITECGQVITGVIDPYYEISGGDPEVYRFDFVEWTANNLIHTGEEGALNGGYYRCKATELKQAQIFGQMTKNEILSVVNDATTCGKTKKVKILSAAKQVLSGVNYRVNVQACDGEQVVLLSFSVALPASNIIEKPTDVTLISVRDATFTIDPCETEYPLNVEPLISSSEYGTDRFFDEAFLDVTNNSVHCANGYNWQWFFVPNVTRFGTEYIVSWLGVAGDDAADAWNDTDGSYSVTFKCMGTSSTTTVEPTDNPCICTADWTPVCCDGVTYSNLCTAKCGGIKNVAKKCASGSCVSSTRHDGHTNTNSGAHNEGSDTKEENGLNSVPGYVWLIILAVVLVIAGLFLVKWLSTQKQLDLLNDPNSRYMPLVTNDEDKHPL